MDLIDSGLTQNLQQEYTNGAKFIKNFDFYERTFQYEESDVIQTKMEDEQESRPQSLLTSDLNITLGKVEKRKPGIIYIGSLPPFMNVTKIRDVFSNYGELGRIFLQPVATKSGGRKKKKPPVHFTEGWVEFKSKRIAKEVAVSLNNTQIGGKKTSKFFDYMWNIKYLPRFKWVHLSERLAYEKAVYKQKLRTEISQAKREANFFALNLDRSKRIKSAKSKVVINNVFKQRKTESEIISSKTDKEKSENDRKEFLRSLFGKPSQ